MQDTDRPKVSYQNSWDSVPVEESYATTEARAHPSAVPIAIRMRASHGSTLAWDKGLCSPRTGRNCHYQGIQYTSIPYYQESNETRSAPHNDMTSHNSILLAAMLQLIKRKSAEAPQETWTASRKNITLSEGSQFLIQ